LLVVVIVSFL